MGRFIDLTGRRFERLTVIREHGRQNGHVTWLCECECGNSTIVCTGDLRQKKTRSCGCLHKEMVAEITKSHELAETRLYNIWANMKQRCFNPNTKDYKNYGGRGITMCEEWLDPSTFFAWAYSTGYADNLTIDRINVDGNYEPSNCRWATIKKQNNNRRSNHNITFNGETHNMQEWAEITGISRSAIKGRLQRGWTIEDTLTKEVT